MKFLHIHGQEENHNPIHIIGTKDELVALSRALIKSLYCPQQLDTTVVDGEGYFVNIIATDSNMFDGKQMPLPYMNLPYKIPYDYREDWDLHGLWKAVRKWYGLKP